MRSRASDQRGARLEVAARRRRRDSGLGYLGGTLAALLWKLELHGRNNAARGLDERNGRHRSICRDSVNEIVNGDRTMPKYTRGLNRVLVTPTQVTVVVGARLPVWL